ncbi:hypothetical protein [Angustibacter peucedani]
MLLEGSDIDELLARVRAEHGPDARIVHAEQKLVGGVAGFFARRRYEVAVAVDEPSAAAAQPAPAAPSSAAPARTTTSQLQEDPAVTTFDTEPQQGRGAPSSLEELLAMADGQDGGQEPSRPAGRPLSTESESFDHLVRDLVARAVPEGRPQPVPFIPAQGGFAAATPRVLTEPVSAVGALEAEAVAVPELDLPALAMPQLDPAAFGIPAHDLYPAARFPQGTARFAAAVEDVPVQAVAAEQVEVVEPAAAALAAPHAPSVLEALAAMTAPVVEPAPLLASPAPSVAAVEVVEAVVPERQYVARHASRPMIVPEAVAALGLPVRELAPTPEADPRTALLDVLADLAVPAPGALRGVQVVVGDAADAYQLAHAWAAAIGEDGDVVLTERSDEAPEELADRARAAVQPDGGVLVVVDAGTTRASARGAGRRVGALGATAVTGVVDARWDPAITRERVAALGGHGRGVDHVAAQGVLESPTPLRLLEIGVQVTWLDGQPATLGAWAAPCLDRWS